MNKTGAIVISGDYQGLGIIRSISQNNIPVYLLDSGPCIAKSSRFTSKFFKCPSTDSEKLFINFLIRFSEQEKTNGWVIYPTTDEMVRLFAINKAELSKCYKIYTPEWQITEKLYNKKLTYTFAEKLGIPIPRTFYPESIKEISKLSLEYPVIIKPAIKEPFVSKTKKKAIMVSNLEELENAYKFVSSLINKEDIMVQEVIPAGQNNLYSFCSMFGNKSAITSLTAKRIRQHPMKFGRATTYAETVDIPELKELGTKFLSAVNYYGLSEVEFMWDNRDKKYKLLEVNARTWGWHTLGLSVGINFPLSLYNDICQIKTSSLSQSSIPKGKWVRLLTDIPVAIKEISRGNLSLLNYLTSLKGTKDAVWDKNDPLPFFKEILLIPYLSKTRGF